MNIQMEIRQKLLEGKHPLDLISEGYSRSAVYFELRKIRSEPPAPAPAVELAERRRPEEVLKPEKGLTDIGATREELLDRVAALERQVLALRDTADTEAANRELADKVAALEREVVTSKDIADMEAANRELNDRVAAVEREVVALRSLIRNAVDTALLIMLRYLVDEKAAKEYAEGWVERNIESLINKR